MQIFPFLILLILLSCKTTYSTEFQSTTRGPYGNCTDELGMSNTSAIRTSQIYITEKGDGSINNIRLIEGNPVWKAEYFKNIMIYVDLREKYNITGIRFQGGDVAKNIPVVFQVAKGYPGIEIVDIRYYVDEDTKKKAIPMDPDKGIQVFYFNPIIETSYVIIFIKTAGRFTEIFEIFFQFELLGCKPETITTTPQVPTTIPITTPGPCNDLLEFNSEYGECSDGASLDIHFTPNGLYQIEKIVITSEVEDLRFCREIIVTCINLEEEDEYIFHENCKRGRLENFKPDIAGYSDHAKYCNEINFCFEYKWDNANEMEKQISIKIIGCVNVSSNEHENVYDF